MFLDLGVAEVMNQHTGLTRGFWQVSLMTYKTRGEVMGRVVVCIAIVLISGSLCTPAFGMYSDVRREQTYQWRGVASQVWVYPWTLTSSQDVGHVSSIYIQEPSPSYRHIEAGVCKHYGQTGTGNIFYAWNPYDNIQIQFLSHYGSPLSETGYYESFEINNFDMGDTWRIARGGTVIKQLVIDDFPYGYALCSSERQNRTASDDNRSSFRNLMKKDSGGTWSAWTNSNVFWNSDPDYSWGSYSASHWYCYIP